MPSPNVNNTPGGGRRARNLGEKEYLPFNHDPKNLGTRTGRPMPKDVRRGSDGFEDVDAFFNSSPPSQTTRSVGRPSTAKKGVASGSSPARTPRTPSRKGKGRMSDLGLDMEDIGAGLVGDEEESPGLESFSTPHNQAYFSRLRDPPPSVTLPRRSNVSASSPNVDFSAIPSPRKSLSHRRLSKATSSRGLTPPDDDDEEEEAFASGQVNGVTTQEDDFQDAPEETMEDVRAARRRKQSIRSDRGIDPELDNEDDDVAGGNGDDFDFGDDGPPNDNYDGGQDFDITFHGNDVPGAAQSPADDGVDDGEQYGEDAPIEELDVVEEEDEEEESPPPAPIKRGRGRPRKVVAVSSEEPTPPPVKRGPGRPKKIMTNGQDDPTKRGRGRPKKSDSAKPTSMSERVRAAAFSWHRPVGSMERHIDPNELPTIGELHVGEGERRSTRVKVEPLAYWRNERIVYKRGEGERVMTDIVKYDPEPARPLGVAGKRARSASVKPKSANPKLVVYEDPDTGAKDVVDLTDPMGIVTDWNSNQEVHRRVACPWSRLSLRPTGGFQYQKIFAESQFLAGGIIYIPMGSKKPAKSSKDNAYVFHVLSGEVQVKVHRTDFTMGQGGSFFIPRANKYEIVNAGNEDARLFFAQGRQLREDENEKVADAELDELQALPPHLQKQLDEVNAAREREALAALAEEESDGGTEPPPEDYGSEEEEEEEPIPPPKKVKKHLLSAGRR